MNKIPACILLVAAFGLAGAGSGAQGQTLRDSVSITVFDVSDLGLTIVPTSVLAGIGDTLTFRAFVLDSVSGDTIPTFVTWTSRDTTVISIDRNTGLATFIGRGSAQLVVDAERIVGLVVGAIVRRVGGTVDTIPSVGRSRLQRAPRGWWSTLLAALGLRKP